MAGSSIWLRHFRTVIGRYVDDSTKGHLRSVAHNSHCFIRSLALIVVALLVGQGATVQAQISVLYDYSVTPGVDRFAFDDSIPSSPIPPTDNTIPSSEIPLALYPTLAALDSSRVSTTVTGGSIRAAMRFLFTVAEPLSSVLMIDVFWRGTGTTGSRANDIDFWIWNASASSYTLVGSTSATTPMDVSLTGTFSINPTNFIDASSQVTMLITNRARNQGILTDYVSLTITADICLVDADCNDSNLCTTNSCVSGACQTVNNTNACDDGNACTVADSCSGGSCQSGAAPNCSGSGDQCNIASCDSLGSEGNCDTLVPVANGTTCDDGNSCNEGETCQAGTCSGGNSTDCSAAGGPCNAASCDAAGSEGNCDILTPINEGFGCDDSNACNVGETCQTGVCMGGTATDCGAAGDQCNTASCDSAGLEGNCDTVTPVANGTTCDDSNSCNVDETCQSGVCSGGAAPDCSLAGDQCNAASCDLLGTEGNCDTLTPINEGLSCDDGNACNVGETCQLGSCVGGAAPDCSLSGDQCNNASCNPVGLEGNCDTLSPTNESLSCDDGNACLIGETCQTGSCAGGGTPNCSAAGDQCNLASCDSLGAEGNCDTLTTTNEGLSCDDGDVCNVGETCQSGFCLGGGATDCSMAGDQCNTAACDTLGSEGNCDNLTPVTSGTICDDGTACNTDESCQAGVCSGGVTVDCSMAGDQCNTATCNPLGLDGNCDTLTPSNEGLTCDDSNVCSVGETCQSGSCTGGTLPDCSASGNQCNDAFCSPLGVEGNCDSFVPINEGLACNDGMVCNVGETCQGGVCRGGGAPDCSGVGDQCNLGSCDPAGLNGNCDIITQVSDGTACEDGNACNVGENCQLGLCSGGGPPDCSLAGDDCNSASCDSLGANGNCDLLIPVADGTVCDDGVPCTSGACATGSCAFDAHTGQINITLDVQGLSSAVTRTGTFVITNCSGSVDTRIVSMSFDATGQALPVLSGVDTASEWLTATEGHTLRRLVPLSFSACIATVNLTGPASLTSGDFQTAVIAQDGLVDITDFSVLAADLNNLVDANSSLGADVTGDGNQGIADFAAIQTNFFTVSDALNACPASLSISLSPFDVMGVTLVAQPLPLPLARISVTDLSFPGAHRADLTGDGLVGPADIRAFARRHHLPITDQLNKTLSILESRIHKRSRGPR